MAASTYSVTTLRPTEMPMPDGTVAEMRWQRITDLHHDPKIRAHYPGWFARNPGDSSVVFIYKERR